MKVKHVYQHDNTGCGIACIAMLANQTYHEMKELLIYKGLLSDNTEFFGTTFRQLTNILTSFNFRSMPRRKFKKWSNIPAKIAIASTNYDNSGSWHWVIFVRDIDGFYIYDPCKRRKKIRDLRGKMSGWFIEILY
ncbi:cysteine peptidase family C39 domain-containing protein [Sphingobacterium spiritivorum]|uniref:Peptidase, C39 family n=1 Tax=Sphingobacterium spiritivorum ATCC 33861 TaxID=525373 RepID=D7VHT9_SPHSI|nr:cysteine peptidase family C39 domain-containing protein [Sphingobacterium spiritivorum]EFK59641.1 peptidase, C39 family [Sphingobacterium spiritivorum ATCC 33861]QQT37701.1 hypothetical protein I6J01_09960 [Sphingobacterium spiritivorum]WQD34504.1 cysteine peptidase family C39 domain-containing protein [Sphingobacterium spiritivorum]SUI97487.1 Peptidase C39 family [Sphingobacterium spiritivorum]